MNFGKTVGEACATFAVTNIDDIFVLVTFFTEATTSKTLTPLQITIGQYVGFTVIVVISMIGYGVSFLFSPEPIGFLGLLPILLGVWWLLCIAFPSKENDSDEQAVGDDDAARRYGIWKIWLKNIGKVGSVTVMNGADNVSAYVPLFSRAKGAEIAVYIVVYYILLGVWCLAAFLVMKQKHILRIAQKYARIVVPFLYMGLGIFIIVESDCFPWSIEQINDDLSSKPGTIVLAVTTTGLLLVCIGFMLWVKLRKRSIQQTQSEHTDPREPARSSNEATQIENIRPAQDQTMAPASYGRQSLEIDQQEADKG